MSRAGGGRRVSRMASARIRGAAAAADLRGGEGLSGWGSLDDRTRKQINGSLEAVFFTIEAERRKKNRRWEDDEKKSEVEDDEKTQRK